MRCLLPAGMDACLFDVLHNPGDNCRMPIGNSIHVNLDSILKEFVNNEIFSEKGDYTSYESGRDYPPNLQGYAVKNKTLDNLSARC